MKKRYLILFAAMALAAFSCSKEELEETPKPGKEQEQQQQEQKKEESTRMYANIFACNAMGLYYLWNEEIQQSLNSWETTEEPISKVKEVRYPADKWTELMDDYEEFSGSVGGVSKSFGYELTFAYADAGRNSIVAGVLYTYADSPARDAGLKRGDIIMKVNGKSMDVNNYQKIYREELTGSNPVSLTMYGGATIKITPKENLFQNPVHTVKVFTLPDDRKVGYMHYTGFTVNSYTGLINACKKFRADGVSDLILDLRYNGGGEVNTELALASMLAPENEVEAGSIYKTNVYNNQFSEILDSSDFATRFTTVFDFQFENKKITYSTKGANIGIKNLYVIMTDYTASASESLICGLMPYFPTNNIRTYGRQSYGKCYTGAVIQGSDFYKSTSEFFKKSLGNESYEEALVCMKNWYIYVMISRYADKNGKTACMPDGLAPDVQVEDDPWDGYNLGDPEETMLKAVLKDLGYAFATTKGSAPSARKGEWQTLEPAVYRSSSYGTRFLTTLPNLPEGPVFLP